MSRSPAAVSIADLAADPHPVHHQLRAAEPVAWIDALGAWLVTSHELCLEIMLDPDTFTVDDPRFSTQQVIGPSMLSLDGADHRRHRDPFAGPFRVAKVRELSEFTDRTATELVDGVVQRGSGDLRADVAGPLAVAVMAKVLDLRDVSVSDVLSWYARRQAGPASGLFRGARGGGGPWSVGELPAPSCRGDPSPSTRSSPTSPCCSSGG